MGETRTHPLMLIILVFRNTSLVSEKSHSCVAIVVYFHSIWVFERKSFKTPFLLLPDRSIACAGRWRHLLFPSLWKTGWRGFCSLQNKWKYKKWQFKDVSLQKRRLQQGQQHSEGLLGTSPEGCVSFLFSSSWPGPDGRVNFCFHYADYNQIVNNVICAIKIKAFIRNTKFCIWQHNNKIRHVNCYNILLFFLYNRYILLKKILCLL